MVLSLEMFLWLLLVGSMFASLFTEALKKALPNISSNIVALFCAFVIGALGMIAAFILMDISFNAKSITSIIIMAFLIWLGSMVSYDKLMQTISQIKGG